MAADCNDDQFAQHAKAIADGVKEVAAELRLINVADFVSFIRLEQFANIKDIVNSAMELYFKHGTLSYGCGADYELEWDRPPAIFLDMDFHHRQVAVRFSLALRACHATVVIRSINFPAPSNDAEDDRHRLVAAIADAKLATSRCARRAG